MSLKWFYFLALVSGTTWYVHYMQDLICGQGINLCSRWGHRAREVKQLVHMLDSAEMVFERQAFVIDKRDGLLDHSTFERSWNERFLNPHHSLFHYTQPDVTNTFSLAPTWVLGFPIWFDWLTVPGTEPGLNRLMSPILSPCEFTLGLSPEPPVPLIGCCYGHPCNRRPKDSVWTWRKHGRCAGLCLMM